MAWPNLESKSRLRWLQVFDAIRFSSFASHLLSLVSHFTFIELDLRPTTMQWKSLIPALALYAQSAYGAPTVEKRQGSAALMRFECSQLVIERLDPLVQPGMLPSTHVHQVAGGNSFNATMTPGDFDPSAQSTCTSCTYADDFSNYWTASLYFKARNGSFKRVPQLTNLGLKGKNGGLTVYYNSPYDGKTKTTAFKPVRISLAPYLSSHKERSTIGLGY